MILVLKLLNSRTWMTLQSPKVIFSGLRNLCSLIDLSVLCNLAGLNSLYSPFIPKNFLILIVWSSLPPKWPTQVPCCGLDPQKSNFSLIFGTLSVGGCWGQPLLFFWKLVDDTQMPKPQKHTDIFIITKILFSDGLRGLQSISKPVERPCIESAQH